MAATKRRRLTSMRMSRINRVIWGHWSGVGQAASGDFIFAEERIEFFGILRSYNPVELFFLRPIPEEGLCAA
jgi:hypothetical protein